MELRSADRVGSQGMKHPLCCAVTVDGLLIRDVYDAGELRGCRLSSLLWLRRPTAEERAVALEGLGEHGVEDGYTVGYEAGTRGWRPASNARENLERPGAVTGDAEAWSVSSPRALNGNGFGCTGEPE